MKQPDILVRKTKHRTRTCLPVSFSDKNGEAQRGVSKTCAGKMVMRKDVRVFLEQP
jgi:hypothetical protein